MLADWIQPGAVVAAAVGGLGLLVSAFRNLETKLETRIDKLETRQMAALKASEERQTTAVNDLKTDFQLLRSEVKSLGDKMDDLLLLLAKGAVVPPAGQGRSH